MANKNKQWTNYSALKKFISVQRLWSWDEGNFFEVIVRIWRRLCWAEVLFLSRWSIAPKKKYQGSKQSLMHGFTHDRKIDCAKLLLSLMTAISDIFCMNFKWNFSIEILIANLLVIHLCTYPFRILISLEVTIMLDMIIYTCICALGKDQRNKSIIRTYHGTLCDAVSHLGLFSFGRNLVYRWQTLSAYQYQTMHCSVCQVYFTITHVALRAHSPIPIYMVAAWLGRLGKAELQKLAAFGSFSKFRLC